jgi:seryl-tRNA synthetase
MLDIKFIRENPEQVKKGIQLKGETGDIDALLALDTDRRQMIYKVEQLKQERNENSKKVAALKKEKKDVSEIINSTKSISEEVKSLDEQLVEIQNKIQYELDRIPNMPHASAPQGKNSDDNVEMKEWGKIPVFDFEVRDHLDLGEDLDILDFKRGGKISGSGFPVYKGLGASLERALINFMLDYHLAEHGYTEIFPPFLANRDSMYGTGQLPKMEEDMYLAEKDDLFLIPTAEVPVTNLHRDEIF